MPSDPLLERVGEERRHDRADPGEDAEEEPEDGAARDGPGRGPPLLAVRQEALDPRLEDLLVEALFDVEEYLGDAEEAHDDRHEADAVHQRDRDRKSTRLNSSHSQISYAVFCLK